MPQNVHDPCFAEVESPAAAIAASLKDCRILLYDDNVNLQSQATKTWIDKFFMY